MPTIVDRDLIVDLLREEFDAVAALCAALAEPDWATPTALPGWTVKDQVSHMIGTEAMLLGERAPEVDVGSFDYLRNDIGRSNEAWVEGLRPVAIPDLMARFESVTEARLTALDAMTQADFDAPSWTPAGPDETYGRFMRIRHFDCFMHEGDMRAALGLPDRDDPRHVASALTEPSAALGYIAGKKAKLPTGTTVDISVTGPVEQRWLLAIAERAAVVQSLPGPATVTVRMPAMTFLRLTGGRVDGVPGDVEIRGDQGLGGQLVTNMAFTI